MALNSSSVNLPDGAKTPKKLLTRELKQEVRDWHRERSATQLQTAEQFGISATTVGKIVKESRLNQTDRGITRTITRSVGRPRKTRSMDAKANVSLIDRKKGNSKKTKEHNARYRGGKYSKQHPVMEAALERWIEEELKLDGMSVQQIRPMRLYRVAVQLSKEFGHEKCPVGLHWIYTYCKAKGIGQGYKKKFSRGVKVSTRPKRVARNIGSTVIGKRQSAARSVDAVESLVQFAIQVPKTEPDDHFFDTFATVSEVTGQNEIISSTPSSVSTATARIPFIDLATDAQPKRVASNEVSRSPPAPTSINGNSSATVWANGGEPTDFSLNKGDCVTKLLEIATEMDLMFTFNGRRGGEYCFERNADKHSNGDKNMMVIFADLGRCVRVSERVDGEDANTEYWTKDWRQFLWSVRGKCQKALKS